MHSPESVRKADYVARVTRGEGLMPWQSPGVSELEKAFRAKIERRKDRLLRRAARVRRPALLTSEMIDQARRNVADASWARTWFEEMKATADYVLAQPAGYVDEMIPELTPWVGYTFFCPNCYGVKTFEGTEYGIIDWNHRTPDVIRCKACGHVYPSEQYPETGVLQLPRSGQTLTFYLNDAERSRPDDRSGDLAWRWAHRPVHPCFSGVIRERKICFMIQQSRALALTGRMTGDARYGQRAVEVLLRLAHCFRYTWCYHDYWDAVADCDALYAAWHDTALPLEWKRMLFTSGYENDTDERAAMMQSYWGAGRVHPSTGMVFFLPDVCEAYDLVHDLCAPEQRCVIEKDLILEWLMEAEPFMGGSGKTKAVHNKSPRIYHAMAAVARCLGIAEFADVALRGYEAVRDNSFGFDGFSHETPSYNDMYLGQILWIPERLHRFHWPKSYPKRRGFVDLYRTDPKLELMLRARIDELRPDGRLLTHGDSHKSRVKEPRGSVILEIGMKRFPDALADRVRTICAHRGSAPTEYALFRLDAGQLSPTARCAEPDLHLPEVLFPCWQTAILRHGEGMSGTILTLVANPAGGHRHYDNLALYYETGGLTMLGDHGYLAEAPAQKWNRETFSHNLVVVDDQCQLMRSGGLRRPSLRLMATSPVASVVEASSTCYAQCREYRRLIALIKGPGAETFALDIFRVKGGAKHDFRLFSEIASSDAGAKGRLEFAGVAMPAESPLPEVGASERPEDIFGLRDGRRVSAPAPGWRAVWREPGRRFRTWMLSRVGICQGANGPGQEMWGDLKEVGRRVRYVDAINEGADLSSTFVAIHEPGGARGAFPVRRATLLDLSPDPGPDAVAIRMETKWGTYLLMSDFEHEAGIDGVRFEGRFGILHEQRGGARRLLSVGAATLQAGCFGFERAPAAWSGRIKAVSADSITPSTPAPVGWPVPAEGVGAWILVGDKEEYTGFPVRRVERDRIVVERFPAQKAARFRVLAVHYAANP